MALTLLEGFDHATSLGPFQTKGWQETLVGGGGDGFPAGRIAGHGYSLGGSIVSSPCTLAKFLAVAQSTTVIGFAIYLQALPTTGTRVFDVGGGCSVLIGGAGTVTIFNRLGISVATGTVVLTAPGWHYIEAKIVAAGASGQVWTQVDGTADLSAVTGDFGTGAAHTFVQLAYIGAHWTVGQVLLWDDIYCCDAGGFFGDVHVETLYPNGDGAHTDWTPSSGVTHWTQVDEVPPDDDTTYVSSSTAGQIDTYTFQDLTSVGGTIRGLQVVPYARKTDATLRQIAPVVRRAASDYVGPTQTMNTSYAGRPQIYETDPSTSAAWTVSNVNAAEFGTKVIT